MRRLKLEHSLSISFTSHFFSFLPVFETISLGVPTSRQKERRLVFFPSKIKLTHMPDSCNDADVGSIHALPARYDSREGVAVPGRPERSVGKGGELGMV